VILREEMPERRSALARRLAPVCRSRRLTLLIANDPRLALITGSAGVHWSEAALKRRGRAAGRRPKPGWLMTAAAHSPAAVQRAAQAGVDAVILSPVFATMSHPGGAALGPLRFARFVRFAPLPVFALGGLTGAGARRLRHSGTAGFAAIGALTPRHRHSQRRE
jgi:thiamine-phosphate pyrophosphorylase